MKASYYFTHGDAFAGEAEGAMEKYKLWAGAAVGEWDNAADATIITDMTKCSPASAISAGMAPGKWKTIEYETRNGYIGTMLWAAPEAAAEEISIAPGVSGWYAVFVGLFGAPESPTLAWLRLGEDDTPVPRTNKSSTYVGNTEETFFKVAKLDEHTKLFISQQSRGFVSACGVTHIKLIPLSEDEIGTMLEDSSDPSTRTMTVTYDGFSPIFYKSPVILQRWFSDIEILRGTDVKTVLIHSPGADKVIYPSKIGHMKGSHTQIGARVGDRHFTEAIEAMDRQGINIYKSLVDKAHEIGLKVHAGMRPAGWSIYEPFSEFWESPFYRDHEEWRCKDRDGTPVTRMSFAVPEVRTHFVKLLEEQVGFGADGAHIVFNRGYPLMLFEEPAYGIFIEKYGDDPRNLSDDDPRITEWRTEIVGTFMNELRDALDRLQHSLQRKERFVISIMVLGNEKDNLQYGVDVEKLCSEGLVDEVLAYKWDFGANTIDYDYTYFSKITERSGVPCSFTTASFFESLHYNKELIDEFIRNKVDSIAIWDAEVIDIYQWSVICRFGHREETAWRMKHIDLLHPPRTVLDFHKLGDHIRDGRFPPYWGG